MPVDQEDSVWLRPGLDLGGRYRVREPLDGQAPGNWAVVVGVEPAGGGAEAVLKIMRGRHRDNPATYRMFAHEARVLARFGTDISATPLLAAGYLRDPPAPGDPAPVELATDPDAFAADLTARQEAGWRPFLVLQPVPFRTTLLHLLRHLGQHAEDPLRNTVLPLTEALAITRQALELLAVCHRERLYYIDHKPEHVTWTGGQVRFLDWNGGEWLAGPLAGSFPRAQEQVDVLNFIGYVAYPLFTGRQIDGGPVRAIQRGTPHPPPVQVADGELLPFHDAAGWLDPALQTILSRPFWSAGRRFPSATAMAEALAAYEADWRRAAAGLDRRLERVLADLRQAQADLASGQEQLQALLRGRWFARPPAERPAATREVQRFARHVQRFFDMRVLLDSMGALPGPQPAPGGQVDGAGEKETAPPAPGDRADQEEPPAPAPGGDLAHWRETLQALAETDPPWAALLDSGLDRWIAALAAEAGSSPAPAADRPDLGVAPHFAPPPVAAFCAELPQLTRQTSTQTLTAMLATTEQAQTADPHNLPWQATWALLRVAVPLSQEIDLVLQDGLGTPRARFAARISQILAEQLRAALILPDTDPSRMPVATLRWFAQGGFRQSSAITAARRAFALVVALHAPRPGALRPDAYSARLAELRHPETGWLSRLMAQVPPFAGLADALLIGARNAVFLDMQAAFAAHDMAQARAWFEAATS